MGKKGISTIIANVLIVLVAVGAMSLLWFGISPILAIDVTSYDSYVSIVLSGGYTFYDEIDNTVTVQVESSGSKAPDYIQIILTLEDGNELISAHDAPALNNRMRYYLNLSTYIEVGNPPVSVSVAPMFIVDGEIILGRRTNAIELPKRVEEDQVAFYGDREAVSPTGDHTDGGGGGGGSGGAAEHTTDGPGGGEVGVPVVPINVFVVKDIYDCQELNRSNTEYVLQSDITEISGTCFNITANNVTLNFYGYNITGIMEAQQYGIYINDYNFTTINYGEIYNFSGGIEIVSSFYNILTNLFFGDNVGSISFSSSSNNILTYIDLKNSSNLGIYFVYSYNNTLENIVIDKSGSGIYSELSANNTFINIEIDNSINSGIVLSSSSDNNITSTSIINSGLSGIALSSSSNNDITSTSIINSGSNDISATGNSLNNVVLDTYYDLLLEDVSGGSELIRKWYYRAHVVSGGSDVSNANVEIKNVFDMLIGDFMTDSSGYTSVLALVDYYNDGFSRTYSSDYIINVSAAGYSDTIVSYNITEYENNFGHVITL